MWQDLLTWPAEKAPDKIKEMKAETTRWKNMEHKISPGLIQPWTHASASGGAQNVYSHGTRRSGELLWFTRAPTPKLKRSD